MEVVCNPIRIVYFGIITNTYIYSQNRFYYILNPGNQNYGIPPLTFWLPNLTAN